MHPKNPFISDYDFDELCRNHAPLADFVFVNPYGNKTIKFADNKAVIALNTALLKANYNIDWHIPESNLCPPIPGRLDYLLHIADLVSKEHVHMLDIGTGASLIYPILGTSHFGWKCTASEVDRSSFGHAQQLISQNPSLKDIEVRLQRYRNNILETIIREGDRFDVIVCNPPFFKNQAQAEKDNRRKVKNLKLTETNTKNFGGNANELWFKGGEEAFIKQMIKDSVRFSDQVGWFTSLISKIDHVAPLKRAVKRVNPKEMHVVDMELGNKKSRFIAWRF